MKVAIAGYGLEGESNYRYWKALGADIVIFDENEMPARPLPEGVEARLGEGVFRQMHGFDLVVRTAGLAPYKINTDGSIWSSTREFFAKCRTPIIGVTGTKGKGTTASLITSILKSAGKKVSLVGNIGQPALDILNEANEADVVVYELSSFQLWDLEVSPQVSVVLMVEPDHLDVHKDFEDYLNAKANIRRWQKQGDPCYYHPTNGYSKQIAESSEWREDAKRYAIADDGAVYVKDKHFYRGDRPICPVEALQIPGHHNVENACAAISAALHFTDSDEAVDKGLRAFDGLPHRLKFVREVDQVKYYDDSIATGPGATIAALKSFERPKILILGGSDKGADFSDLKDEIAAQNMRAVITIGQTGPMLTAQLAEKGVKNVIALTEGPGMDVIVNEAKKAALSGDIVILSPACASFDMFKSYSDRGDQFIAAVNKLQ